MRYVLCIFLACIATPTIFFGSYSDTASFSPAFADTPATQVDTLMLLKVLVEEPAQYQSIFLKDTLEMKALFLKYISNQDKGELISDRTRLNLELINPACREYFSQLNNKYLNEFGRIMDYEFLWFKPPYFCVQLRTGRSKVFNHKITFECCKINGAIYFRSCHNPSREFINPWYKHEEINKK
jgi:hypothetical protein